MLTVDTLPPTPTAVVPREWIQGDIIHTADSVTVTLALTAGKPRNLVTFTERFVIVQRQTSLALGEGERKITS